MPDRLIETFSPWRIRPVKKRDSTRDEDGTFTVEWTDARIDHHLVEAINEHRPDVLVIDPWRTFYAGQESDNTETEAALSALDELADEFGLTTVASHHFSQARAGSEPEDWWRGATRLADWASVRITLEPAYTLKQAKSEGMDRHQARQYAHLRLLLRRLPTPQESDIRFDPETGLWVPWRSSAMAGEDRRIRIDPDEIVRRMKASGGEWDSTHRAAELLGVSDAKAKQLLEEAERVEKIDRFNGPRSAIGWRVRS